MRVIECNRCGEALSAATDDELAGQLASHLESEHGDQTAQDELREFVGRSAYDAMDS
jgi:predicted small metal-binding protein